MNKNWKMHIFKRHINYHHYHDINIADSPFTIQNRSLPINKVEQTISAQGEGQLTCSGQDDFLVSAS